MQEQDFEYISNLVEKVAGIVLDKDKIYLIESRLNPVLRSEGFNSINDLVLKLRWKPHNELHDKVIDVMTTNETFFFRDEVPFEAMKSHIIPALIKERQGTQTLNIWSAACSSGQEPYSLSILLRDNFPTLMDWKINILGTDISDEMLEKAEAGVYSQFEIERGMPAGLIPRYFEPDRGGWRVKDKVRAGITFKKLNLLADYGAIPRMDVIFLRNVLIYFDLKTKKDVLERIKTHLLPDGYLFLGQSETALVLSNTFETVNISTASCFRLKSTATVAG